MSDAVEMESAVKMKILWGVALLSFAGGVGWIWRAQGDDPLGLVFLIIGGSIGGVFAHFFARFGVSFLRLPLEILVEDRFGLFGWVVCGLLALGFFAITGLLVDTLFKDAPLALLPWLALSGVSGLYRGPLM